MKRNIHCESKLQAKTGAQVVLGTHIRPVSLRLTPVSLRLTLDTPLIISCFSVQKSLF